MSIRFGTSGWRAIIAEEFTFENVRRVTNAICSYLINSGAAAMPLVIANDTRFMGEKFGTLAAELAAR
ncbi:MAG: phosphoglucosamine mutase, partial [Blastocatellia bacterium]